MSYKSEPIAVAIQRMNRQYFLPAIQREFVWKPEQIIQLFDSIMRGYPISSFLFWDLKPENRDKWQVYRFLEKAYFGGSHNELANTDGANNVSLVLDGQQRLTSLMIGLKGMYVMKKNINVGISQMRGVPNGCTLIYLQIQGSNQNILKLEDTINLNLWRKHLNQILCIIGFV